MPNNQVRIRRKKIKSQQQINQSTALMQEENADIANELQLTDLPNEILKSIFDYIRSDNDLKNLSLVNKNFNDLINNLYLNTIYSNRVKFNHFQVNMIDELTRKFNDYKKGQVATMFYRPGEPRNVKIMKNILSVAFYASFLIGGALVARSLLQNHDDVKDKIYLNTMILLGSIYVLMIAALMFVLPTYRIRENALITANHLNSFITPETLNEIRTLLNEYSDFTDEFNFVFNDANFNPLMRLGTLLQAIELVVNELNDQSRALDQHIKFNRNKGNLDATTFDGKLDKYASSAITLWKAKHPDNAALNKYELPETNSYELNPS